MTDTATASCLMSSEHDPEASAASQIRRRVRTQLTGWGLGPDDVDDALMVVEELVANAVDHAHTRFLLEVRLSGDVLHVAVRDRSSRAPQIRRVDPWAVRGRGLQLVERLSRRWGCEHHPDGKTVWAELTA